MVVIDVDIIVVVIVPVVAVVVKLVVVVVVVVVVISYVCCCSLHQLSTASCLAKFLQLVAMQTVTLPISTLVLLKQVSDEFADVSCTTFLSMCWDIKLLILAAVSSWPKVLPVAEKLPVSFQR